MAESLTPKVEFALGSEVSPGHFFKSDFARSFVTGANPRDSKSLDYEFYDAEDNQVNATGVSDSHNNFYSLVTFGGDLAAANSAVWNNSSSSNGPQQQPPPPPPPTKQQRPTSKATSSIISSSRNGSAATCSSSSELDKLRKDSSESSSEDSSYRQNDMGKRKKKNRKRQGRWAKARRKSAYLYRLRTGFTNTCLSMGISKNRNYNAHKYGNIEQKRNSNQSRRRYSREERRSRRYKKRRMRRSSSRSRSGDRDSHETEDNWDNTSRYERKRYRKTPFPYEGDARQRSGSRSISRYGRRSRRSTSRSRDRDSHETEDNWDNTSRYERKEYRKTPFPYERDYNRPSGSRENRYVGRRSRRSTSQENWDSEPGRSQGHEESYDIK